jgi:polyferredoxin
VSGCGATCFLRVFQAFGGLIFRPFVWGAGGLFYLYQILIFILLTALLGKKWCGWICPFGLFQDWLAFVRKKIGIRASILSSSAVRKLSWIKYAILGLIVVIPALIAVGLAHPDLNLLFCAICPAGRILPLFAGDAQYLSLDVTNPVILSLTLFSIIFTGTFLAASFYRDRFYCLFCPMAALLNLIKPLTAIKLLKEPKLCQGCASCRRVCPMDIDKVHLELAKTKVQSLDCVNCAKCVANCASDSCLSLSFYGKKYLISSKRMALGAKKRP